MNHSVDQGIDLERRKALKTGGGAGLLAVLGMLGLLKPGVAAAEWNKTAFSAKAMDDALNAMGVIAPQDNPAYVQLTVPEIAENGAIVPVKVASTLAGVEQISIFVEKNPNVMAANFVFPQGTEGMITTRVKMAQTSNVVALVKAGGKFYRAAREVKVTAGGCGG